jgi:subtilase family serine protease
VFFDGNWWLVGGTSAATPIVAGIYALAGNAASLPNNASHIYSHASHLFDVTTGNNGTCGGNYECTAKPGYDGPTGLGTPNGIAAF